MISPTLRDHINKYVGEINYVKSLIDKQHDINLIRMHYNSAKYWQNEFEKTLDREKE